MTKRTCGKECDNKCENEKDKECDKEDIVTKLVTDKEDSVTRSVTKRMTRTVTRRTVRSPGTSPALPSLHAFMLHLIPPAAQLQSAFAMSHKTNDKDNIWGQFHYGDSRLKVLRSLYA